jgi:hypothetical protein
VPFQVFCDSNGHGLCFFGCEIEFHTLRVQQPVNFGSQIRECCANVVF